ncbi:hypothetical protein BT96DRAFT_940352 [Gymnopus androsaceus JB14]|uniref:Uncharacterized protein n=1 Tax=Gymnopus androsaceus JB14 TaxID=1447944 RepID=A0A6A4HN17_9AGAR|nr:hypothetical protein BT96DRAFT_940352 [Gymnopus androsaceus JB14]
MSLPMTKENLLKNRKKREDGQSSSTFTLPSDLEELPASVLRLHSKFFSDLSFSDGLCGTFLPDTKEYITSPNCDYIPSPPMGSTRNLYRRSDAHYGDDDPVCWPQPFNLNYPWSTARKEGVVKKELTDELESQIELSNVDRWHGTRPIETISGASSLRNIRTPSTLFLTIWTTNPVVSPPMYLSHSNDNEMGAFVWNDRDARMLFNAGLPVFFIRPWNVFDRQIVEQFTPLLQPKLPQVEMGPANPPYHTITMGQAGSDDKFSALRQASIRCFDTVSPFQNLHIPGGYSSSFQLGNGRITAPASSPPSHLHEQLSSSHTSLPHHGQHAKSRLRHSQATRSAKPRKPDMNSPTVQRNTFADLPEDDPLVPPAITAWKDVNKTINQNGVLPGKRSLAVPDPGLFFGLQHRDRQSPYLFMWQHFRDPWLAALEGGRSALKVEVWRKILAYPYIQPIEPGQLISPKMQVTLDAKKLVKDVIRAYDSRMLTPVPSTTIFDPSTTRKLIRELCMINFRSKLLYVDQVLDTTAVGWNDHYNALKHFWALLNTWPLQKPGIWQRGVDMDLSHKRFDMTEGAQWERMLAEYYVQSLFSVLKHAPSLPRRLDSA